MIRRKCSICQQFFDLELEHDDCICTSTEWKHIPCYKNSKLSRNKSLTEYEVDKLIKTYAPQSKNAYQEALLNEQEKLKRREEKLKAKSGSKQSKNAGQSAIENASPKEKAIRIRFTDWLISKYQITIPSKFYITLDSVYRGTYKGIRAPIPVEDLWDMWIQKYEYLQRAHDQKAKKGEALKSSNVYAYDLAILVNKYDAYLAWKKKQYVEKQDHKDKTEDTPIDYSRLFSAHPAKLNGRNDDEIDIAAMLDEMEEMIV